MRPGDYAIGDATARRSGGWEIPGILTPFKTNPRLLLTRDDHDMVQIWALTRTGDMGGARPMFDSGGIQQQPAIMEDAMGVMDAQAARVRELSKGGG